MQTATLIADLQQQVQSLLDTLETELQPLPDAVLQHKPAPDKWSALECLEHLNRYARYYHPALAAALQHAAPAPDAEVRFTWLGRKSCELVRPENQKLQKTLARMNPARSHLTRSVLTEFRQHQEQLLALLAQAADKDLNCKAVPVEFFQLLKLRTGEAFLFIVAHAQRHMQQAQRAAAQVPAKGAVIHADPEVQRS